MVYRPLNISNSSADFPRYVLNDGFQQENIHQLQCDNIVMVFSRSLTYFADIFRVLVFSLAVIFVFPFTIFIP